MKRLFERFGKITTIVCLSVIILLVSVFVFISPLAEYLIDKNSKEWVGRKVTMGDLSINLLTGIVKIEDFKLYEPDDNTIFTSADNILVNITLYKAIFGTYEVTEFSVDKLFTNIIQSSSGFNFDDLMVSDSTAVDTTTSEPTHFYIKNIKLSDSKIEYSGTEYNVHQTISSINVLSDGIGWDQPKSNFDISFDFSSGGRFSVLLGIDQELMRYTADLNIDKIGLDFTTSYLKEYINIKEFAGTVSCKSYLSGSLTETSDIAANGTLSFDDMLIKDPDSDTLIAVKQFMITADTINMGKNLIDLKLVNMDKPYIDFELYDNDANNFTELMPADSNSSSITDSVTNESSVADNPFAILADYVNELTSNFVMNSFNTDSFAVINGRVLYKDFTLLDSFTYDLTEMSITSSNFSSNSPRIEFNINSTLNKSGALEALLSIDPKDYYEMDLYYKISGVLLPHMSPYSKYYVAYPFYSGVVQYESTTTIRKKILTSNNKLFIERIEVGNKYKHKDAMDVPLRLAVALLRDRKGNINLDLPVSGDLNDPDYHIGKVIWQVLKNIILKAVTSPYDLLASALSVDKSALEGFGFDYLDTSFVNLQTKSLDALTKVMNDRDGLFINIVQYNEPAVEQERYAAMVSRRQYWMEKNQKSLNDSLTETELEDLKSITIKDSAFVQWVDSKIGQKSVEIPIQEKIILLVGSEKSKLMVKGFEELRNIKVREYLTKTGADSTRFKVYTEDPINIPASESKPKFVFTFDAAAVKDSSQFVNRDQ